MAAGNLIQTTGKILCEGYEAGDGKWNSYSEELHRRVSDLTYILELMITNKDLDRSKVIGGLRRAETTYKARAANQLSFPKI